MDGRNRRIEVLQLGAAALATLFLATTVAAGADAESSSPRVRASAVTLSPDVPAPSVSIRLPAGPVGLPEVRLPAPDSPAPTVPVPVPVPVEPVQPPQPPSLPAAPSKPVAPPSLPSPSTGPAPSGPRLPVRSGQGALDPTTVARPGTSAAPDAASSESTPTVSTGRAGSPAHFESARASSARPRRLLRLAFEPALRGRPLRQLQRVILRYRGCLRGLTDGGRRALELRAGLFGSEPTSQREIAHRIGVSPPDLRRLQRTSMRELVNAGERGLCGSSASAAALAAPAGGPDGPTATSSPGPGGGGAGKDARAAGAVLADVYKGGPGVDLDDGKEGATESLLFFVLALLALLGPAAVAIVRRRRASSPPAVPRDRSQRPLLLLDVDGVIVIDPRSDILPPGRLRPSPFGLSYVPDRTGELLRELATRFDIVWTTGWEQYANTALSNMLGLSEELPVISFGKKARAGSSGWKIKPVDEYAGDRPIAWLDDNFGARHERWAADRARPTLLVRVDARAGLTPGHVERLLDWADRLGPPRGSTSASQRRLHAS